MHSQQNNYNKLLTQHAVKVRHNQLTIRRQCRNNEVHEYLNANLKTHFSNIKVVNNKLPAYKLINRWSAIHVKFMHPSIS